MAADLRVGFRAVDCRRKQLTRMPVAILAFVVVSLRPSLFVTSGFAQEVPSAVHSQEITLHSASHLVLVDVTAMKNGLPDKTLRREDFQLFDNDHPVLIKTFDSGAASTTRALALWFVVQCNMRGWEMQGSDVFAGHISLFKPALMHLDKQDTLAVAHWCDNGDARVDLLPTNNVEDAAGALEQVLEPMPSPDDHSRTGELALQKTLQLIVDATRSLAPQPLPVVIFLYDDYSAMPRAEADHFIGELLETSAIAFGLKDRRSPHMWLMPGEQKEIARYIAVQTGGEYLVVAPETYAAGLDEILQQLHFRYELGFRPEALDGKRHKLRVALADAGKNEHRGIRLRYRAAYVPIRNGP